MNNKYDLMWLKSLFFYNLLRLKKLKIVSFILSILNSYLKIANLLNKVFYLSKTGLLSRSNITNIQKKGNKNLSNKEAVFSK